MGHFKKIIGGSDVRTDIRPTYGQFNYVETKKPRDFTLNVVYENYDDLMYFIHDTKKNYKKYYYTPGRRLTINLIGKKLNFFQVAKINGMFTFESIAIFFKSNEESINDTKLLDKGNKSIRDEISEYSKEMLKEIESLIKVLPDDIKKIINNKIDSLLASYQREKNKLSKIDDISFEEEEIKLEIESKDPDVELYLELQNIKLSCNYHEKLLKDITSIDKCLEIFNTDINNKPDNIDSLEDIVRTCIYLIGIIDDKNRLKFSKKIKELLVGTKNECSSDLQKLFFTQSEIVLTVEGLVNTRLKVKLLEVLEEITIYSQKVLSYLDLLKSLEATKVDNIVNDGSINGTIMIMKYIVSHLENKKNRNELESEINKFCNEYIKRINSIIDNIDNTDEDYKKLIQEISEKIHPILEKLNLLANREQNENSILSELYNSIDILNSDKKIEINEKKYIESWIGEFHNKIFDNNDISLSSKEKIKKELLKIINKWIDSINDGNVFGNKLEIISCIFSDLAEVSLKVDNYIREVERKIQGR